MKEVLALIFATLIQPLIEAIDRNTAAKGGCTAPAPAPAAEAPAAQEPAAKPGRKKAAAQETPPAGGASEVSVEDIIAHAKSLSDEAKDKLKTYVIKTFGKNSPAELNADERAKLLKLMIEKGATDTRTPAPAAASEEW